MTMQNPKPYSSEITKEISSEILEKIFSGKNPQEKFNTQSFLISGMSELLNHALAKEREFYLEENSADKANGYASRREVNFGTAKLPISVPRSRSGDFYPSLLQKYGRNIGAEHLSLLEGIILNCKSFRSIANSVRSLGLSYSPKQLESLLCDLFEEAKRFNARQLEPDWAFIYIDAKVTDLMDEEGGSIKKAVHFTVIGVNLECKKELLLSITFFGSESLELWKKVIVNLKNRGLTRVLMLITDDFSGLNKMASSLLPGSDHQLCLVHLMRNLKKNLNKEIYEEFGQLLQEIYLCPSFESAYSKLIKFIEERIKSENKTYANYLKERSENYLHFTKYPNGAKSAIRYTNAVEGINNAIEIARRNSGGYFHSEREITVKLKMIFDSMAKHKWHIPIPTFAANIQQINQLFFERFGE
jgi:transposase-like protein